MLQAPTAQHWSLLPQPRRRMAVKSMEDEAAGVRQGWCRCAGDSSACPGSRGTPVWSGTRTVLLMMTLMIPVAGEMAFSFCENVSPISDTEIALNFASGQQPRSQCTCKVIPTMGYRTLLSLNMKLAQFGEVSSSACTSRRRSNVTCEPFAAVIWGKGYQVAQCARKEGDDNTNNENMIIEEDSIFLVQAMNDPVSVTLHNHKMWDITAHVLIKVIEGHVNIECHSGDTSMVWDADMCPCDRNMVLLEGIDADMENVSNSSTGVIVAAVCVVIFLSLVAPFIAGVWRWRKKRQPGGEKDSAVCIS